ncbi:protein-disulfide isomerase [Rhizobium leguminosarum]|nr:protein-disulfide isomerase [Rhizobium leguminosarum]
MGDRTAIVTIVEYGDYECPHCAAAQPILAQILAHFGSQVCLVYRHFPLVEVHPHAAAAAEAAEFAGAQGLFWQMHQAIFAHQQQLNVPLLISLAANLKLSPIDLRDALASDRFEAKVQGDFIGGVRSGVNGTPTFFVNGMRHDSPYGVATLSSAIDQAILGAAARSDDRQGER